MLSPETIVYTRKWTFGKSGYSQKINKLTLYDWISILGKADREHSGYLLNILGERWNKILYKTATLRNHLAHARLEDPVNMWSELIDFLISFLPLSGKIEKWIADKNLQKM